MPQAFFYMRFLWKTLFIRRLSSKQYSTACFSFCDQLVLFVNAQISADFQCSTSRAPSVAAKYLTYNCSCLVFHQYGPQWKKMSKVCGLQVPGSRHIDSFRLIREEVFSAMILSIIISNSYNLQDDWRLLNISKVVSALTNAIICKMEFGRKYLD